MELFQLEPKKNTKSDCKFVGQLLLLFLAEAIVFAIVYWSPIGIYQPIQHNQNVNNDLVFVHVLFRHGNRTPEKQHGYPNDPYINETYQPYGPGALTNGGKLAVYNLGKFLRSHYNDFLGDYYPNIVHGLSSWSIRCRISLLLLLSSLFPPPEQLRFVDDLNWQPIEINYNPKSVDQIFLYILNCPKYSKLLREELAKAAENNEMEGYNKLASYISSQSGLNVTSYYDVFILYAYLIVQNELGFKLPEWTNSIFPEPLASYALFTFSAVTRSEELRRVSGGFLLKEIIESTASKIEDRKDMKERKINLYSGHDFTVIHLLGTLGIKLEQCPPYAAFVSIEVHKRGHEHVIKIYYQDYSSELPKLLKLPYCEEECPFEKFTALYSKYLPTPSMCQIDS